MSNVGASGAPGAGADFSIDLMQPAGTRIMAVRFSLAGTNETNLPRVRTGQWAGRCPLGGRGHDLALRPLQAALVAPTKPHTA